MGAMGLDRRSLLVGSAAILLAGCGRGGAGPTLRASVTGKGDVDMRRLLPAAGISPGDLKVEYSEFPSGHQVVEALNAGSLDFGSMSEIPPVFATSSSEQNFRQIAVVHGDVNNQVVLVPRGSRIRELGELKGKRVGYVRATTAQYFLIRMLESVGLGWGDITPVEIGVADGAAAFASGALDAWAIYGFPIQRAIAADGARILKTANGFLSGNYVAVAHVDALADPEKVVSIGKYLRLVKRAYAWSATHEAEWAKSVARDIGVPLAFVEDQFRRRSAPWELRAVDAAAIASQQRVADLFAAQRLIPRRVDVRPLWDDRFTTILQEKV